MGIVKEVLEKEIERRTILLKVENNLIEEIAIAEEIKELNKALLILNGVSKSFKIEMQEFDLCDCPYQINTFIEKYNIQDKDIISITNYDRQITMFYKV